MSDDELRLLRAEGLHDSLKIGLVELRKTCESCPNQWEGRTDDGQVFYARARHGRFRASIGATLDDAVQASIPLAQFTYDEPKEISTIDMLCLAQADLVLPGFNGG